MSDFGPFLAHLTNVKTNLCSHELSVLDGVIPDVVIFEQISLLQFQIETLNLFKNSQYSSLIHYKQ